MSEKLYAVVARGQRQSTYNRSLESGGEVDIKGKKVRVYLLYARCIPLRRHQQYTIMV